MLVAALVLHPADRARIRRHVASAATVEFCDRAEDLPRLVGDRPVTVVIVEPRDAAGTPVTAAVQALQAEWAPLPVVAYLTGRSADGHDIVDLVRAGVSDIVVRGPDDATKLAHVLAAAEERALASTIVAELRRIIPVRVLPIVSHCLLNAREDLSVGDVAAALGVTDKTIANRLAAAEMPSPRSVITWCRLLVAARLLETAGRTLDQVSRSMRFASVAALSNLFQRYTGLRPTEIRERGGMRCVLDAFRAAIRPPAAAGDRLDST